MSDIVLSAGVRSNLLHLQQTSNLIDQTQIRLSTGKGVKLLGGDTLTVNFNETATSSTTVTGVDYTNANASPLSISPSVNWAAANGAGDTNIDGASADLTAALTSLRSES